MKKGGLVFFCGKMGAGKSTKAREVALEQGAVLLSEDEWLASLYPKQIRTLQDYIKLSNLLKPQIKSLVESMLAVGTSVVMDFPANTIQQRAWFRAIIAEVKAPHSLIYIDAPNEVCLAQIDKRRIEQPQRATTDTAEMFEQVSKHFVEPSDEEGFNLTRVVRRA